MAEKDKAGKVLEDYNDVFADIYNTLLFRECFIEEDKLECSSTESIYKSDKEELREQRRDVLKVYCSNNFIVSSLGIENQASIEENMPIRIMGYDYTTYRNMTDNKKRVNPVITIVLNFTNKKWDAPKSLHELLQVSEEMSTYVQDYGIKVYDIAFLEDEIIEQFTSDFKHIVRFFKLKRLGRATEALEDDITPIKHVEAVLDMFRAFSKDERYIDVYTEELKEKVEKGEEIFMCSVIDYYEKCREFNLLMFAFK